MKFNYEFNGIDHSTTKFVIYKIENTITNQFYIGQTKRPLHKRWTEHSKELLKELKSNDRCFSNIRLKRSFDKTFKKVNNHDFIEFSILEITDSNQDVLDQREIEIIQEYRKIYGNKNIFNIRDGGAGNFLSIETKEKLSKIAKGRVSPMKDKTHTEETKNKIKKANEAFWSKEENNHRRIEMADRSKGWWNEKEFRDSHIGENHPMFGKQHTEDSRKKMTESRTGERNHFFGKTHTEESKNKIAKTYDISLKNRLTGEVIRGPIVNLTNFAKQYNLNYKCLNRLVRGKLGSYRNLVVIQIEEIISHQQASSNDSMLSALDYKSDN